MGKKKKEYRVVASYHCEVKVEGNEAYPVSHTVAELADGHTIYEVNPQTVGAIVRVCTYDNAETARRALEAIEHEGAMGDYVPVVMVHNLPGMFRALAPYVLSRGCEVIAKGENLPMTITAHSEDGPALMLWDTMGLFDTPISELAAIAGLPVEGTKDKARALFCYLSHYLLRHPWVDSSKLGIAVLTRTSVVRQDRKALFSGLKGQGMKKTVGTYWKMQAKTQLPKTNDELFSYVSATRGGLSFVGSAHASKPYDFRHDDLGCEVVGYDAVSQYPAHMVCHRFPQHFVEMRPEDLTNMAQIVLDVPFDAILNKLVQPFPVAFSACFRVKGLKMKPGTPFEGNGIATLAQNRFADSRFYQAGDVEYQAKFTNMLKDSGYMDIAVSKPEFLFGKLVSCDECLLWLTEIELWALSRVYSFDWIVAVCGYGTLSFCKPTDMSVLGVFHYYRQKGEMKAALAEYRETGKVSKCPQCVPDWLVSPMENGTVPLHEVESLYDAVKTNLNSLYGIEVTNEARPASSIGEGGIEMGKPQGIADYPEMPTAWYQMGQRVAAWGRLAQVVNIELLAPYCLGIISGDTDSLKAVIPEVLRDEANAALAVWGGAISKAKEVACERVARLFPGEYEEMAGVGQYVEEMATKRFCAGWNKAYLYDEGGALVVKIAGVKKATTTAFGTREEADSSYCALANALMADHTFEEVCGLILGYNVIIDHKIADSWALTYPDFGATCSNGEPSMPVARPVGFTMNSTKDDEKEREVAMEHNPKTNNDLVFLSWVPGEKPIIGRFHEYEVW